MRRNSFRITLSAASVLVTFLACSSYAAKKSRSGGDGSPVTVVIDAGHGGFDRGGIPGQRVSEKDMTLDVARRLKSVLEASGYRVVMTRDSDVFVPLGTRTAIANSYRNAIFVSVHFNSATRSGASGIETYFYSRDSLSLASAIHHYVAGGAPSDNRGVRRRGYYVLRRTNIPAVLVECGFLTNPTEAAYAQNASYRQKLAEAIAAEEDFIETGRHRSARRVIGSGGLIGPANFDFGADARCRAGCICKRRASRGADEQGWRRCRSSSHEIFSETWSMHRVRRERT